MINSKIVNLLRKPFKKNINSFLFTGWASHEYLMLNNYNINEHMEIETIFHSLTFIWQYVGLFIISHDVHHKKNPSFLEEKLGQISLFCYGGFRLEDFSAKHQLHHLYPGDKLRDPDFSEQNILFWYLKFMISYVSLPQIANEYLLFQLSLKLNINLDNLILFWIMPVILSSIQLFFYGTYLVHEKEGNIYNTKLPKIINTLTCYNFGNHSTHHQFPQLNWYEL